MKPLRRMFPYMRPYVHRVAISMVLLAVVGAVEGVIMLLLKPIFDDVLGTSLVPAEVAKKYAFLYNFFGLSGPDIFLKIAAALLVLTLIKCVCIYFANYFTVYTGQRIVQAVRNDLFGHIMRQSAAFFGKRETGMLISRVVNDVDRVQDVMSRTLADFVRQMLTLVAFMVLIFYIDPLLSTLSLIIIPVLSLLINRIGKRMKKLSWHSQELLGRMSSIMQEDYSGYRVVQAFGMEKYETNRFQKATIELLRFNLRVGRIISANPAIMEMIGGLIFIPFLVYAYFNIRSGAMTTGLFAVFLTSLIRMYDPIRRLSRMHLEFQQTAASVDRILEVMDTREEIVSAPGAPELPPVREGVEFKDVTFRYGDGDPVLREISLKVRRGEVVALVGSSGAGKSTLVNLIPRFYDVIEGAILIDGHDIREVNLASLRSRIAVVTQETFLFNDTVRNNIRYGAGECSDEQVVAAAEAALANEFIQRLPDGYDTVIGERGSRLSGGERQRLAIARAILRDSPLLILDEATSSLDSESEALVQRALSNLIRNRTTFVIAHRLSTVRNADRILVLDGGRIVESGTHDELLAYGEVYRKLYQIQFAGQ